MRKGFFVPILIFSMPFGRGSQSPGSPHARKNIRHFQPAGTSCGPGKRSSMLS